MHDPGRLIGNRADRAVRAVRAVRSRPKAVRSGVTEPKFQQHLSDYSGTCGFIIAQVSNEPGRRVLARGRGTTIHDNTLTNRNPQFRIVCTGGRRDPFRSKIFRGFARLGLAKVRIRPREATPTPPRAAPPTCRCAAPTRSTPAHPGARVGAPPRGALFARSAPPSWQTHCTHPYLAQHPVAHTAQVPVIIGFRVALMRCLNAQNPQRSRVLTLRPARSGG